MTDARGGTNCNADIALAEKETAGRTNDIAVPQAVSAGAVTTGRTNDSPVVSKVRKEPVSLADEVLGGRANEVAGPLTAWPVAVGRANEVAAPPAVGGVAFAGGRPNEIATSSA